MQTNSLHTFIDNVKQNWHGLDSASILACQTSLKILTSASMQEPWLKQLHTQQHDTVELYRDSQKGFLLLAHVEHKGQYRVPHNHGAGWVFYTVQYGEMEMATYQSITSPTGKTSLVTRGKTKLLAGQCNTYLPGDIHDTRCLSDYVLMFRLTSSDFKIEKKEGRLIQYL